MLRESKAPSLHVELFQRHSANPILTARDWPYPAHTVFNAGACQLKDETILLVRVEDRRGHSHLTVARSNDGVSNWHVDSKPSFAADPATFRKKRGGWKTRASPGSRIAANGSSPTRLIRPADRLFPWRVPKTS